MQHLSYDDVLVIHECICEYHFCSVKVNVPISFLFVSGKKIEILYLTDNLRLKNFLKLIVFCLEIIICFHLDFALKGGNERLIRFQSFVAG